MESKQDASELGHQLKKMAIMMPDRCLVATDGAVYPFPLFSRYFPSSRWTGITKL